MSNLYRKSVLGGTFDHFHAGHIHLLTTAFMQSSQVTIGVVVNPLSSAKPFASQIEDFNTRKHNVEDFLRSSGYLAKATIIPLSDVYGPTLTSSDIKAIFVTTGTKPGAERINLERKRVSLPPLGIVTVPHEHGDDHQIISSSRIRAGEIDRHGASYLQFFLQNKSYHLPASLRSTLQTPLGPVIKNIKDLPTSATIITVGDIVSMDLIKAGYTPALRIIDYHTRRESLPTELVKQYFSEPSYEIPNPPGTINPDFADIFIAALGSYHQTKKSQIIAITGEEDLLTLPALLLSPLGTIIVYGQPKLDMVTVKVTPETKALAKSYLGYCTTLSA